MYGRIVLGVDGAPVRAAARGRQGEGRHDQRRGAPGSGAQAALQAPTWRWSRRPPASRSRRTRPISCAARSRPCSSRGTAPARSPTASARRSATTSAPPSTCRRWCSATVTTTRARASASPATRPPARTTPYGDFLINAQGEDVVAGIRNTEDLDHMAEALPEDPQGTARHLRPARGALPATCATPSSRSSRASSGCCRPASASAPAPPPCGWRSR